MKLSVSLPDKDVEFLDSYAEKQGLGTRSAVLHQAVKVLRDTELTRAYEAAMDEWVKSEDAALWETTSSDGIDS